MDLLDDLISIWKRKQTLNFQNIHPSFNTNEKVVTNNHA